MSGTTTGGGSLRRTPLHAAQRALGARFMAFSGWELPLSFAGIVEEHQAVRSRAGLFDVSHMGEVLVEGREAPDLAQRALTNDVAGVAPGRAVYSPMCREDGGTLDDLIALRLAEDRLLLVVNAANRERDAAWLAGLAGGAAARVRDVSEAWAALALQGPAAEAILRAAAGEPAGAALAVLRPFRFLEGVRLGGARCLVSRTGYTGEDGFEVFCRPEDAEPIWACLLEAGAPLGLVPCGLGARDTLRLEAGLPLYGHELREDVNPLEAGLERFVRLDKPAFVGREALRRVAAEGPRRRLVGLALRERGGVPRSGCPVRQDGREVGEVTSGSFAPTLRQPVALALVAAGAAAPGTRLAVEIRGREVAAEVVALPFYRRARAAPA